MILENGFCTKCGHKLKEDDLYCPECGLPQFTAVVEEKPQRLWLYFLIPFIIAATITVIVILLDAYMYLFIFIPFIFIGGKRRTKKGNAISGLFAGASIGIIIGMLLVMAGVHLF